MQPVYRNTQETTVQNPARVVDGNYVTRTVANLTITKHGDYNGVYNYSNFKTDSTRKWVKSDNANITIEYKKENHTLYGSSYSWNLYNNNVLAIFGSTDNNPWSNTALSTPWGNPLPILTRWGKWEGAEYQMTNGTAAQVFNPDPDSATYKATVIPQQDNEDLDIYGLMEHGLVGAHLHLPLKHFSLTKLLVLFHILV